MHHQPVMQLYLPPPGVQLTEALAIDCEGVGCGQRGEVNCASRVSIVNERYEVIYDKFVKPPLPVKDYRGDITGISKEQVDNGKNFQEVVIDVKRIVKDRKLVGHALHNDFRMLTFKHPEHLVRDTSKFELFTSLSQQSQPSLKTLAKLVLGINIQEGYHDSVIDARTAMQLYQKHKQTWEQSEYGWPPLPQCSNRQS